MEIKPVPQIEAPAYPTQDELRADKRMLQNCLPRRWRKTKGLAGALSLLVAANMTGCGDSSTARPDRSGPPFPVDPVRQAQEELFQPSFVAEASYWTRSIFEERQAMLGCIAMMPPAVIQEDAAKQALPKEPARLDLIAPLPATGVDHRAPNEPEP
jgi:hypothetical protein